MSTITPAGAHPGTSRDIYGDAVVTEWRVTVRLHSASRTSRAVLKGQVAEGVRDRLGQLAAVSAGSPELFVYADTEAAASEAAQVARELIGQHGLLAEVRVDRWNPLEAQWDDGTEAGLLPAAELADEEHQRQIAEDTRRSQATGVAQWTVRVTLSSRHDAAQLARRLGAEGVPALRRGKSVVLGASNEDAARELALRAAEQVPAADVQVERTFVWSPPADYGPFLFRVKLGHPYVLQPAGSCPCIINYVM